MLRTFIATGALVASLMACTPVPTGAPASPTLANEIATVVGRARTDIGRDLGGGVIVRNAYNDGDTLVFEFTLAPFIQAAYDLDPSAFTAAFVEGVAGDFCGRDGMGDFLRKGGAIRMEFYRSSGQALEGVTISNCPR